MGSTQIQSRSITLSNNPRPWLLVATSEVDATRCHDCLNASAVPACKIRYKMLTPGQGIGLRGSFSRKELGFSCEPGRKLSREIRPSRVEVECCSPVGFARPGSGTGKLQTVIDWNCFPARDHEASKVGTIRHRDSTLLGALARQEQKRSEQTCGSDIQLNQSAVRETVTLEPPALHREMG